LRYRKSQSYESGKNIKAKKIKQQAEVVVRFFLNLVPVFKRKKSLPFDWGRKELLLEVFEINYSIAN